MIKDQNNSMRSGSALEVASAFLKLGLTSFGGPIAHLGYFRTEFVERRRWLSEDQFGHLLAICQFLPGPASSQLGFSIGLLRAGWLGGLAAFLAFTLPSAILLVVFAALLPVLSGPAGQATVHGLKIVAFAVVADAVLGMAKKICTDRPRRTIALLSAAVLLLLGSAIAQLAVVASAALAGLLILRSNMESDEPSRIRVPFGARTGIMLIALFVGLLFVLPVLATAESGLLPVAGAFYRAGALVFGGGHVVLPLLQDAVVSSGWVSSNEFLAGYGASQAIPGPMFAFAAYLGSIISSTENSYLTAATALAFLFLPGLLLVAGVLPFWQALSHNRTARNAISGINAAVVGLLGAALYDPIFTTSITGSIDFVIALVAFGLMVAWRASPLVVVLWCVSASVVAVLV
ncbi:chromate efflux transporter [Novilysobacter antarcticus]|uniref:chromate efflux transporter n=1 Tax=Novilysobacter antarcticus TaxID=2862543 RepID=UPI001FEB1AF6|nr:chromate efflux transporter [Lysobacter antarcticus]